MKPLIHLFRTKNNFYFYDVNRNENVKVDEEIYCYLDKFLKDEINKNNINKEIESKLDKLKEEGYLSNNRVKEIKHPATDLLDTYLSRKMKMITIQLTRNCNLRCEYCPYTENNGIERTHQDSSIDFETIKKALHILRDNSIDSYDISVNFYGGEPLLEFDLIKKTVDYCKKIFRGKLLRFSLTTNATLFTEEIMDFFEREKFNILISLDGPKHLNDKNRRFYDSDESVFDRVIDSIKIIEKNHQELFKNISLNMVIDPTTKLNDYLLLFKENRVLDKINIRTQILDDYTEDKKFKSLDEFNKQYSEMENTYRLHIFNDEELTDGKLIESMFFRKYQELLMDMNKSISLGNTGCPSGPCIPGIQRMLVDVNGFIYPCERISEINEFNIIGNVDKGIMLDKVKRILNVAKYNKDKCTDCFAFRECGFCVRSYQNAIDEIAVSSEVCENRRINFHNKLVDLQTIKEYKSNRKYKG